MRVFLAYYFQQLGRNSETKPSLLYCLIANQGKEFFRAKSVVWLKVTFVDSKKYLASTVCFFFMK